MGPREVSTFQMRLDEDSGFKMSAREISVL